MPLAGTLAVWPGSEPETKNRAGSPLPGLPGPGRRQRGRPRPRRWHWQAGPGAGLWVSGRGRGVQARILSFAREREKATAALASDARRMWPGQGDRPPLPVDRRARSRAAAAAAAAHKNQDRGCTRMLQDRCARRRRSGAEVVASRLSGPPPPTRMRTKSVTVTSESRAIPDGHTGRLSSWGIVLLRRHRVRRGHSIILARRHSSLTRTKRSVRVIGIRSEAGHARRSRSVRPSVAVGAGGPSESVFLCVCARVCV